MRNLAAYLAYRAATGSPEWHSVLNLLVTRDVQMCKSLSSGAVWQGGQRRGQSQPHASVRAARSKGGTGMAASDPKGETQAICYTEYS